MTRDHPALPVRLVVTDDLARSRVTVFFRLLLALPHLVVVAFWGIAAFAVSVVLWLALVVEGRAPETLQSFVGSYLRYSVQVSAYVHLAAAPYPRFGGAPGYPVDLEIDASRQQSRGRAAARLILALPTFLVVGALGGGAWFGDFSWVGSTSSDPDWAVGSGAVGLASTAAFLTWFAALALGRSPRGLRDLVVYCIGYTAQALAFFLLVTDRYPTSDPDRILVDADLPEHPVSLELHDSIDRSRLTVFFRLLLALPHVIWLSLWTLVALVVVVAAWAVALVVGRIPSALHRFLAAWVRYGMHVGAFLFVIGGPFPGFVGAAGSYPVDLIVAAPRPQRRAVTLFRGLLAVPALLLGGAFTLVVWVVALLGWWASLVTGRMPEGLRNLGAVALRYTAQVNAYLFLVTDKYPYAAPIVRSRPRDEQLVFVLEPPVGDSPGIEPA